MSFGTQWFQPSPHLGSTTLLTDQSGNEVGRVQYSPYGSIIEQSGTLPTDRLYTGQRWEDGIELYDYRARFYDPWVGSFISPDTLVPEPVDPQNFNRYGYVKNNPIKFTDPSGHCLGICLGIGIALTVAAIFFYNEMPVGEGAPPHTPVKNYIKSGTDMVGDTYALYDEYPENIAPNAAAVLLPFVSHAAVKGGVKVFELFHGTAAAKSAFENGIDVTLGGGQLGLGFYVTPDMGTAGYAASMRALAPGADTPKLVKFTVPADEFDKLNIIELQSGSPELRVLTDAWINNTPIPEQYQYLINDYDAILAPMKTPVDEVWQLKFNPKAQDFVDKFTPEILDQ